MPRHLRRLPEVAVPPAPASEAQGDRGEGVGDRSGCLSLLPTSHRLCISPHEHDGRSANTSPPQLLPVRPSCVPHAPNGNGTNWVLLLACACWGLSLSLFKLVRATLTLCQLLSTCSRAVRWGNFCQFLDVNEAKDLRRDQHLSRLRQLHATGAAIAENLSQQGAGVVRYGLDKQRVFFFLCVCQMREVNRETRGCNRVNNPHIT